MKYFDFNTLYFENGNFVLKNPKGDTLHGIRSESLIKSFFISIDKKKIKLENRLTVSLEASKICIKNNDNDKGQDFYFSKAFKSDDTFLKKIKYLKMLKYYKLINIQPAVLTLGNELKIGYFNLSKFEFSISGGGYLSIEEIYNNITALFELFDIEDCFVDLVDNGSGNKQIILSQGGQNYFYELDSSTNKLKFVIK